jgi:hypothetical protein
LGFVAVQKTRRGQIRAAFSEVPQTIHHVAGVEREIEKSSDFAFISQKAQAISGQRS